ncbi:hypothetical protein FRB98_000388 [Tulasnella sp. 332]|nr:hypothetical protein FRB98_000388 [Tulasnella sp. 332]
MAYLGKGWPPVTITVLPIMHPGITRSNRADGDIGDVARLGVEDEIYEDDGTPSDDGALHPPPHNPIPPSHALFPTSLFHDLTLMTSKSVPATQGVISTVITQARAACHATRNCQTLYRLISRARDICEHTHSLIGRVANKDFTEEEQWAAFDEYTATLEALEGILDTIEGIPTQESRAFGTNFPSWFRNRETLQISLRALYCPPFQEVSYEWEKDTSAAFCHDDLNWLREICDRIHRAMSSNNIDLRADAIQSVMPVTVGELLALVKTIYQRDYNSLHTEAAVRSAMGVYILMNKEDPPLSASDWAAATSVISEIRIQITQTNPSDQDVQPDVTNWDTFLDETGITGGFTSVPAETEEVTIEPKVPTTNICPLQRIKDWVLIRSQPMTAPHYVLSQDVKNVLIRRPCTVAMNTESSYCGERCQHATLASAPKILPLEADDPKFNDVRRQFDISWKHKNKPKPKVKYIYEVIQTEGTTDRYERYRNSVEAQGNFLARGKPPGNECRRWYGSKRVFESTWQGNRDEASIALDRVSIQQQLLQVVGRGMKLANDSTKMTSPIAGYHSVSYESGPSLSYDEVVVYDTDAIVPAWLVVYGLQDA